MSDPPLMRRRGVPPVACGLALVGSLAACEGAMHPVIHAAVHSTLNDQFRRAGVRQPVPISEAVEYFCLGDNERARTYLRQAYRENAPEQLVAVARVLRQITPMLGQYGERIVPFLDFLANTRPERGGRGDEGRVAARDESAGDAPGPSRRTDLSSAASARCESNLGREGESCTGSPQCEAGLGCVAQVCQRRRPASGEGRPASAPVIATAASTPPAAQPRLLTPPDARANTPRTESLPVLVDFAPPAGGEPRRLTRAQINEVMRNARAELSRCTRDFRGTIAVALTIEPSGIVSDAHVGGDLAHSEAADCIETVAMSLTFPRFTGSTASVVYPFSADRQRH